MPIIHNPEDYSDLPEYNPSPSPQTLKRKHKDGKNTAEFYVHESDLWEDVMKLYETGEFPERLARSILVMATHIVDTWVRFRNYDEVVREDCKSRAIMKCCAGLLNHKFDPNRGSKVYSWLCRVIINESLQEVEKENKRRKVLVSYGEVLKELGDIEVIQDPDAKQ